MPMLPLIVDPGRYRPCIQDLLTDGDRVREYWLSLFERHIDTLAALPVNGSRLDQCPAWHAFREAYLDGINRLRAQPDARGCLTVLELTRYRDEKLAEFSFGDPFHELKLRENEIAIRQYPKVVADLDAMVPGQRHIELIRGLFAGNLFDMGSKAAVAAFARDGGVDFATARSRVRSRPWAVDDLDAWLHRIESNRYRQCLFFVDNAGPDIVLGVMPFVRELCRRGTQVVLAANSAPALNDVTAAELSVLLDRLRGIDASLIHGVRVVASGCMSPLIDLGQLSRACCDAAAESDLLVLEGMGRAIESNYDARFSIDTLKIALVKDSMVAEILGVELFEPVFRFEAPKK
ncbi:MAG: DUF89 family protein [Phycisphaerae bacterium]|nr:DUF89 family protein [Phycisphaerae bacterium]